MESRQAKAERYRAEAARLRAEAELRANAAVRQQILNIAAQYDRLAASIERQPPLT
jgi:hypothetical protein